MKSKKLLSLLLAATTAVSLAAPAFAAASNSTEITTKYDEITIDVVLLPTGKAAINPYEMPVKAMDTHSTPAQIGSSTLSTAGQIATQPLVMYNKTNVELSVGATVSAANVTGLELVKAAPAANVTDKQAMVYLEAIQESKLTGGTALTNSEVTSAGSGTVGTVKGAELVARFNLWPASTYSKSAVNQVLVDAEGPTTKRNLAFMAAGTGSAVNSGGFVLYRLGGAVTTEPETAWAATDKFDVKVAFSFTPVQTIAAGTVSLANASIAAAATTNATVTAPTGVTFSATAQYEWTSSDTSKATIAAGTTAGTAVVTAVATGSSNIGCTVIDGNKKYTYAVAAVTVS